MRTKMLQLAIVIFAVQVNAATVELDNEGLESAFDPVIPVILANSGRIVSIDFSITVNYPTFAGGVGANGEQFLLEVFREVPDFRVASVVSQI